MADWLAAFERAGHRLAALSRRGSLERGLRAVLAHHVIFHWNRIGLAHTDQLILSTLARNIVMSPHTRHLLMTDTASIADTDTDTELIARRFPLVPRSHPHPAHPTSRATATEQVFSAPTSRSSAPA